MKNVLLLDTSVGSLNQGDEIINISIKKNWSELFENNYIMNMASHTPMYTLLQSIIYQKKLSVFKDADYKFLCGTNALYTNMLRPLPTWNINLLDCGLAKKTICLGAGIGINSKKVNLYTRTLYNKVLSHEYTHSVRPDGGCRNTRGAARRSAARPPTRTPHTRRSSRAVSTSSQLSGSRPSVLCESAGALIFTSINLRWLLKYG